MLAKEAPDAHLTKVYEPIIQNSQQKFLLLLHENY